MTTPYMPPMNKKPSYPYLQRTDASHLYTSNDLTLKFLRINFKVNEINAWQNNHLAPESRFPVALQFQNIFWKEKSVWQLKSCNSKITSFKRKM